MAETPNPLNGVEPTEKGARAIERIKERFKIDELPETFKVFAGSESGIHDLYMNLNRQLIDGKLEEKTKLLIAVGVASTLGSGAAVSLFTNAAIAAGWEKADALEAVAVASTCTIFNGYYRFRHQIPEDMQAIHANFKAPFNANAFMKSRLDGKDMEAICVAVSSVNGCHMCVEGHVAKAKSLGITDEQIDEIIKASAVASAAAGVLSALAPAATSETISA